MAKGQGTEYKMLFVKKNRPDLHEKIVAREMSLTDAFNEAKRVQMNLSEYRGTNTRKKEFSVDFKRIMALHDPTQEELIEEIKKAFPLTWKTFIKTDE